MPVNFEIKRIPRVTKIKSGLDDASKLIILSRLHIESIDTVSEKLAISHDFLREFGGGVVRGGPTWMWLGTGTSRLL